nr:Ac106 [Cnaphalocrocis medinalis granulovirus]
METTVDAKEFAKQLIADKCKNLIESANMLPEKEMAIMKQAHLEYTNCPNVTNFNNIKKLILQTKYVEESVEYKNFNRGTFLIALNLIVNKCQNVFPNHKAFFVTTSKRLEKIDPDMKSSPKDMLKHYYECIEEMENPKSDDHYMVAYAKSIMTKILYDAVSDMTNMNGSTLNLLTSSSDINNDTTPIIKPQNKKLIMLKKAPTTLSQPSPQPLLQSSQTMFVKPILNFT